MKGSTKHWTTWGQYVAITAAYAACYEIIRYLTSSQWVCTAGLRMSCLLLMPIRYWPALAFGEMLPVAAHAMICIPQFGIWWGVSASVPMVVICMGCVKPIRGRWTLYTPDGRLRMGVMVGATLACAALTAIKTSLTLLAALLYSPGSWPEISVNAYFWAWLLSTYLFGLTLTTTILALHKRIVAQHHPTFAAVWRSPLWRDVLTWASPTLALLAWCALAVDDEAVCRVVRLAMVLPVLAMTWRHGWHGSAIGGMAASIALTATSKGLPDPAIMQGQAVLSLIISGALLIGARSPREAIPSLT